MPRRRRFDSCFVAGKHPHSDYHCTFKQGGVATSARRYYVVADTPAWLALADALRM
jgi:hypothetical protein